MSKLLLTIGSKALSRGLRPSKRLPRNSKFLTECAGMVGRDGSLQSLDELTRLSIGIGTLLFDAQTGSFTAGNTLYQTVDGVTASATILSVTDDGSTGSLDLYNISGIFQNNEIIYESALGSELVTNGDMELDSDWVNWGTPTLNVRSDEQKNGGLYSRKFIIDESFEGIKSSLFSTATGNFYKAAAYVYPPIADNRVGVAIRNGVNLDYAVVDAFTSLTSNSWNEISLFYQESDGGAGAYIVFRGIDIVGTWYIDDASIKQVTNAALANGVVTLVAFPYPQMFVFTNVIIICTETQIYEWVSGALVHKLTVAAGSTWSALDFNEFAYLSNGTVAVKRNALNKTYSTTTDYPTNMAALNFNGQVIIGSPDSGYEA